MNEHDRFWVQFLPMIMQQDRRLWFHTLTEDTDGEYKHLENMCAKCQAEWLIEESKK